MPAAKIVPNGRGILAMLHEGWVASMVESRAQRVAAAARASAPVGETGNYQASIHVTVESHPERVVAHVGSDVDYAMIVEANTGNLARALSAAG
jgi:hypothetical protein